MKRFFAILFFLIMWLDDKAQAKQYPFHQLYQLDSIGKTSAITRHFGELYFNFLCLVEKKLKKSDTATLRLVRHFEMVFAQFYIDACEAHQNKEQIPLQAWQAYFTDTTLESFQYNLLGTNAHLNGGLAEAIAGSYTPGEWKWIKKKYYLFNSCLNKTYRLVYGETIKNNKRAKTLHVLTFGLDRILGQYYLYKWRKRQMRLTEYYFTEPSRYKKLLNKINGKKEKIDRLVYIQF